ncbi:hypothetical protein LINPERPRIM_LOCUS32456 [Linum perenne]
MTERVRGEEESDSRCGSCSLRGFAYSGNRGGQRGIAFWSYSILRPTLPIHSPPSVHSPSCNEHRDNDTVVRSGRVRVFSDHVVDLRPSFCLSNPLVHLLHVARRGSMITKHLKLATS